MQRIYLPHIKFSESLIISEIDIYHQLTRVMRARVGQEVIFFDGSIQEDFVYKITHIDKKSVRFLLTKLLVKNTDVLCEMNLYQALPNKLEKIEYIIQKSCEIGYRKLVFFSSERSQKQNITDNKTERFQKILIEALQQCGGNYLPEILFLESIDLALDDASKNTFSTLVCHTDPKNTIALGNLTGDISGYNIFIGPEGGFCEEEIQILSNFHLMYFGERILRCETVSGVIGFYLSQKK